MADVLQYDGTLYSGFYIFFDPNNEFAVIPQPWVQSFGNRVTRTAVFHDESKNRFNIKCSGIPNHKLNLKLGVPIMLLRNIDQSVGLCNGTRLIVTDLAKNVIGANVITGNRMGEKVFIPIMNLIHSNSDIPIKFQIRQFPVTLCFAMTINNSQGQSLSHVGLYLPKPVFTHGQLYVALSRVKSRKGLKILILDDEGIVYNYTKNVVYHEVFDNI